jgi:hypothetical protein
MCIASLHADAIGNELFGGVMFRLKLAGRYGVVFGMQIVPVGGVRSLGGGWGVRMERGRSAPNSDCILFRYAAPDCGMTVAGTFCELMGRSTQARCLHEAIRECRLQPWRLYRYVRPSSSSLDSAQPAGCGPEEVCTIRCASSTNSLRCCSSRKLSA